MRNDDYLEPNEENEKEKIIKRLNELGIYSIKQDSQLCYSTSKFKGKTTCSVTYTSNV
jgi:predicted transcriptional regulator YheO